nr:EthD family reductase [Erwinia sp. S38]
MSAFGRTHPANPTPYATGILALFRYDLLPKPEDFPVIKFSVLYPNRSDAHFDHDYYRDVHLPLIKTRMGDACLSYEIDKPLGEDAPFIAACHIYCASLEAFQQVMAPHAEEFTADVANFTNVTSVKFISDVVVKG